MGKKLGFLGYMVRNNFFFFLFCLVCLGFFKGHMVDGRTCEDSYIMNSSSLIDSSGTPLGVYFLVLAQIVQLTLISSCLFFMCFVYTVKSNGIKFSRKSEELSLDGGMNFLFFPSGLNRVMPPIL